MVKGPNRIGIQTVPQHDISVQLAHAEARGQDLPIAIAVALGNAAMLTRISDAQAGLEADGTLQGIRRKWLANPYVDQSLSAH